MHRDDNRPQNIDTLSEAEMIGELIRHAGPSSRAADYDLGQFKPEAEARWLGVVARRKRRRARTMATAVLALAAALGAVTVAIRVLSPAGSEPAGVVERVVGALHSPEPSADRLLAEGDTFGTRTSLRTAATGAAALRLENGIRIRLDGDSEVVVSATNHLMLLEGAVYVDASGAPAEEYLEVETSLGVVRDIGTVFQVRTADSDVVVRVREGLVSVRNASDHYQATAGEEVVLNRDGTVTTASVKPLGAEWSWAMRVAPTFELEGATLGAYLDWLRRETGWLVRLDAGDLDDLRGTHLHGSLEGLVPDETLDLVLPGCGLTYRLDESTLILAPDEAVRTRA